MGARGRRRLAEHRRRARPSSRSRWRSARCSRRSGAPRRWLWVVLVRAAAGRRARGWPTGSAASSAGSRVGGRGSAVAGVALAGGFALEAARGRRGAARDRGRARRGRVLARRAAARGAGAGRGVRAAAGGGVAVPGARRARWRGGATRARGRCWRALALLVPAAWFVPEWLGSGRRAALGRPRADPQPGPARARRRARARVAVGGGGAAAGAAVARASRSRCASRAPACSRAAGGAWVALVAAMAQAGFSGEPRYALPGVALLGVAGAAGLARAAPPRGDTVGLSPMKCLLAGAGRAAVALAAVPAVAELPRVRDRPGAPVGAGARPRRSGARGRRAARRCSPAGGRTSAPTAGR